MKKILIICGTGVATSTVVAGKVKTWLHERGLGDKVTLHQANVSEVLHKIDEYDIVLSTTIVPETIKHKVIDGVPLLTGVGVNEMYRKILDSLK